MIHDKLSPPLTTEYISTSCHTTKYAAQKAIQRLEGKNILNRFEFKNGRGGWTRYEIPEGIYQEILAQELRPKLGQTSAKPRTELRPESCSSSINIKTTTTLLPEWKQVNIEPLRKFDITEKDLIELSRLPHLTPEILQESIDRCAFDFKVNNREASIKTNPYAFIMGIMRNGIYRTPRGYEEYLQRIEAETKPKRIETEEDKWAAINRYKPKS